MRRIALLCILAAGTPAAARDFSKLPANAWTLLHEEDGSGGKEHSRVVAAESVGRLYLWGIGGERPERNRFARYELETFDPAAPAWREALPRSREQAWADGRWPPFRIYGQGGTDGPRLRAVGSMRRSRVSFYDFDGVARPSPVPAFNQCCWDARRRRIVHFNGGATFALDPASHTWSRLAPETTPTACEPLAWASLCYDPVNDEVLLFGGGLAMNPDGGAHTWLYDPGANAWRRPDLEVEPPLRCNAPIVYDAASRSMVMFGGYDQQAARNDTWVYRCAPRRWERREPRPSPPPMFTPATAALPGGGVLVCGTNALTATRTHSRTRATRETWAYDVEADAWRPAGGDLELHRYTWLTATGSKAHGVVFLVAIGHHARRTYAFRYDPDGPAAERAGAPPGTLRYKYPDQKQGLERAPEPDPEARKRWLDELPPNRFVPAEPPATIVAKTWSGACCDTDRGVVVYTGGGHSGYSGNDVAHYDVATNRWSLSWPPYFPPFLEGTNASVFGYSYTRKPWSQHTYRWYTYDPISKLVVYCPRRTIEPGTPIILGDDPQGQAVPYEPEKHGYWTFLYDPVERTLSPPCFGRPFRNSWGLCLAATPQGVYAMTRGELYGARIEGRSIAWSLVDGEGPERPREFSYEFMPLVYDSRRQRLLFFMGKDSTVEVYARGLGPDARWARLETAGPTEIGREAVYLARHDVVVLLGGSGTLSVLDAATGRWRVLDAPRPEGKYGVDTAMVYDPVHDVCVLLLPERFSGPLGVYLLRFDPETARTR
ncbi:MAG: hypothetical protein ACLF0G_16260 [Candidatus Brocadiia bacterium]